MLHPKKLHELLNNYDSRWNLIILLKNRILSEQFINKPLRNGLQIIEFDTMRHDRFLKDFTNEQIIFAFKDIAHKALAGRVQKFESSINKPVILTLKGPELV